MATKKMTEEEICTVGEIFLKQKGWDLYPEVVLPNFGGRPDFIGTKGNLCTVVEAKTSLTYPVIEQLTRWQLTHDFYEHSEWCDNSETGIPHLIYALTGGSNRLDPYSLKYKLMKDYRIGWIHVELVEDYTNSKKYYDQTVDTSCKFNRYREGVVDSVGNLFINYKQYKITERLEPNIQVGSRQLAYNITKHLQEDMKCAVAGVTGREDNFMTPFKRTLNRAIQVVTESEKPLHPNDILVGVEKLGGHHYSKDSTFKNCIGGWLIDKGGCVKVSEFPPLYKIKES